MSKLLMSNSQVQAICRNRNEQRNLSDKLEQLDCVAFQSKDAIHQDLKTWRKFRRENGKNSGWSSKSIRPEPGEDVFFPSSSGRASSTPNSPSHTKDTFTKPWAYTYSQTSHNKIYKELVQVSKSTQKALDLNFKSSSLDSTASVAEEDQPGMLKKHATKVQALNKAASALTPKSKLLSLRHTEEANGNNRPNHGEEKNSSWSTLTNKMAVKVSEVQKLNKFSPASVSNKTSPESVDQSPMNKLVKSVSAIKGLMKSKEIIKCYKCGNNVDSSEKEERFPKVALAYKGLHRAQSILKLSTSQVEHGNEEIHEGKPRVRKCCANCRLKKKEPISQTWKASNEKIESKWNGKVYKEKSSDVENDFKPVANLQKFSSSTRLAEYKERKKQFAKQKVSKCFEIRSSDMAPDDNTAGKNENGALVVASFENISVDDTSSIKNWENSPISEKIFCKESRRKVNELRENSPGRKNTSHSQNGTREKLPLQKCSKSGKQRKRSESEPVREPLQNLNEVDENVELNDNSSFRRGNGNNVGNNEKDKQFECDESVANDEEEYPSNVDHQQVMKLLQEEVIDKLNKLQNKQKNMSVRKLSTVSRASSLFRTGGNRKRKTHKTSGVDVFKRIAKYMLFELWRRRKQRSEMEPEKTNENTNTNRTTLRSRHDFFHSSRRMGSIECFSEKNGSVFMSTEDMNVDGLQKSPPPNRFLGGKRLSSIETSVETCSCDNKNAHSACNQSVKPRPVKQVSFYSKTRIVSSALCINDSAKNNRYTNAANNDNKNCANNNNNNSNGYHHNDNSKDNNNNSKNDEEDHDDKNNNKNNTKKCNQINNANEIDSQQDVASAISISKQKNRKPPWIQNDSTEHALRSAVYHKGVRIFNYVSPEKRYLTANRGTSNKKDPSIRWHSAVGAMVNKHEISEDPMLADKTFPKQARHRALHKMIEANHTPPPDDSKDIQNELLHSRIRNFLQSVEPYRQK